MTTCNRKCDGNSRAKTHYLDCPVWSAILVKPYRPMAKPKTLWQRILFRLGI